MNHALLVAAFAITVGACAHAPEAVNNARARVTVAIGGAGQRSDASRMAIALDLARSGVSESLPEDDDALKRRAFLAAVNERSFAQAARIRAVWFPPSDDAKVAVARINFALANDNLDSARSLAWNAASLIEAHRPAFMRLWYRTWVLDEAYFSNGGRPHELGPEIDRIRWLGGGSSLTFRLESGDRTTRSFKPTQTRYQSSPRGEIAAYRLCPLIHCDFEVPHNDEVRIERSQMLALNGRHNDRGVAHFDRRYADLIWFEEGDRRWLHGASEAWVPEFRQFGIEFTELWRPLVDIEATPAALAEVDVTEILSPLFNTRGHRTSRPVRDLGDLDGAELARQLSNLHVFDYLLNNWDRYSGRYPGANTHWHRDHFVSIDNGAAFPRRGTHGTLSRRVERRMQHIQIFSRQTMNAVRWMQPTALFPILFPPSSHYDEKVEFSHFIDRRKLLLVYVDGLIDDYGEERVLSLQ